jgi:6-phosphogluconolactonase
VVRSVVQRHGGLGTSGAPLAASADGAILFASLREPPICVVSYRIDRDTGELALLSQAPVPASTPFISSDPSGRFLMGAAYYGNQIWVRRLESDGSVVAPPIMIAEEIRTPHSVLLHANNRFAYVAATGHEEILAFQFDDDTGNLARGGTPGSKVIAGTAARHLALHCGAQLLFCMNETSGIIDSFRVHLANGSLTLVDSADPRPLWRRD